MASPEFHDKGVEITVTRSAGADRAVVVLIDTPNWEPDGSDGGPGLRVLINNDPTPAYEGIAHTCDPTEPLLEAKARRMAFALDDIDYLENQ